MSPSRAKAREIAALEAIAETQKLLLAGQEQLAAKLELIANLAPSGTVLPTSAKPSKDK